MLCGMNSSVAPTVGSKFPILLVLGIDLSLLVLFDRSLYLFLSALGNILGPPAATLATRIGH